MKQFLLALALTAITASAFAEGEWLTDLPTALSRSAVEHKAIMLDFTGSDWCGWCMKLKSEVFDQQEFITYAHAHLILVEVDFPHRHELAADQKAANNKLAKKYGIEGFPTVIVLDEHGNKIGQSGYRPGGPKSFITEMEGFTGAKSSSRAEKSPEPDAPRHAPPAFVPIAPVKPNYYADLALKGISGSKDSRLVLINNITLTTGETGKVRVRDTKIDITCKEIRDDSVTIILDGKEQELKLANR